MCECVNQFQVTNDFEFLLNDNNLTISLNNIIDIFKIIPIEGVINIKLVIQEISQEYLKK